MAKEDWVSCKIPVKMVEAIDRVLDSNIAKKNGVFSRTDFLTAVIRMWFSRYEKDFGIFVTRDIVRDTKDRDLPKPFD
jgi:hypothetical protein